jgi:gamma-glutamyltranspeptidase
MKETPVFSRAAAAAPHHLASEAGRAVLEAGGNAIEAMVAMAATIAVVYPHMNGIGGDGFWLVREPSGKIHALAACGASGSLATLERYRALELSEIPARGPHAALTVPGAVGGWAGILELARALGGRLPLADLLSNAIGHAKTGIPVSPGEAHYDVKDSEACEAAPGFADVFMLHGKRFEAGDVRVMPALAATLAHLAHAGLDDFYRGDIGREIAADLERIGSPVTRDDLRRFETNWRKPLSIKIPGITLYNHPPPTQGLASLLMLGIYSRLDIAEADSFDYAHGLVEAAKRAWRIRDGVVTDFDHLTRDPAAFLTAQSFDRETAAISMTRAAPFPLPSLAEGDTVWMGAIDGSGIAVSYIQSLFWDYGSGCVLPKTGILMQNRGRSFSLDPKHLNALKPGRKPFHTLNPPLAVFDDGRILSYGTMGGDPQPQIQAQIFARYALHGVPLSEALDRPRFVLSRAWDAPGPTLKFEDRFDPGLLRKLEQAGHVIESFGKAYSDAAGHTGMLVRHPNGSVAADHDPRADGGAAGL